MADEKKVDSGMTELSDLQNTLDRHVAQNDRDHAQFATALERLDVALRGNGRKGLIRQVDETGHRLASVEKVIEEIVALRRWFIVGALGVIASAILQVLGLVGGGS